MAAKMTVYVVRVTSGSALHALFPTVMYLPWQVNKTWQMNFVLYLFTSSLVVQIMTMTVFVASTTSGSALHALFPTVQRV
jgi:hypothetical protein